MQYLMSELEFMGFPPTFMLFARNFLKRKHTSIFDLLEKAFS